MEPTVSSETSAVRTQTSGNYPKRNKLHLEHGESLKTKFYGPFFFLSLCDLFLASFVCVVEKPSPVDFDLPMKFFLSHIGGEERHGKLTVEQDSSRRRREERETARVGTCQTGGLGVDGSICWPPRSPDLTHMNLYLWRYVGNQAIVIIKQYT